MRVREPSDSYLECGDSEGAQLCNSVHFSGFSIDFL